MSEKAPELFAELISATYEPSTPEYEQQQKAVQRFIREYPSNQWPQMLMMVRGLQEYLHKLFQETVSVLFDKTTESERRFWEEYFEALEKFKQSPSGKMPVEPDSMLGFELVTICPSQNILKSSRVRLKAILSKLYTTQLCSAIFARMRSCSGVAIVQMYSKSVANVAAIAVFSIIVVINV